jgi:DNA (cytosine-5)-methyltransferase 1
MGSEADWFNFPTQSPVCNGNDGLSARLDSITFSKWRNESIKAGGNAIVPQVVYQIFKAIQQYNNGQFNK